ncbi:NosD domain-containing protein [Methanolobus sp.]|uniref:right-handed parallel beta-helix repeat-containing protein n=1 Tax=Methanolobus sp. TaxID=1874737 RepID=UPI0025D06E74|nr:NosD domain-containing protein [Methanolobus sp.]
MKIDRNIIFRYLVLLFVLALYINTASGAEIRVGESETYSTITEAYNSASYYDVIIVGDGIYTENISIQKPITIRSENGSASTIIQPDSDTSVFIIAANNVTIDGFHIKSGTSSVISVLAHSVSNCTIINNELSQYTSGIVILDSNNMTLNNNSFSSNSVSIILIDSINCTLSNNTMSSAYYNFGILSSDPDNLEYYLHNIDSSNQVDGKTLYYLVNEANIEVPSDAGQVYAVNSSNITVKDITVSHALEGIAFINTSNSKIENVDISFCDDGILLLNSNFNTVTSITVNDSYYGIHNHNSDNNRLISNTINNNDDTGVQLCSSNNITMSSNTVSGNGYQGIGAYDSTGIILSGNTANENYIGLGLYDSNNNTLSSNTANRNARAGIRISDSRDNLLIGNTADDSNSEYSINAIQTMDSEPVENFWLTTYGIERNSKRDALQDFVLLDNYASIMVSDPVSYGIEVLFCYNTTLSENHATGSDYALRVRETENITVNKLVVTGGLAGISFAGNFYDIHLSERYSAPASPSGKTNVNGYVDIAYLNYGIASMPMYVPMGMDIKFSYDDSGMSTAGESSVALYNLSGNGWVKVPGSTLNTQHNYVSASIDAPEITIGGGTVLAPAPRIVTLALFKDSERTGSSVIARERSQGTITDLPRGSDGGLSKDTVVKSSDSTTTLTLFTGTKALDPLGNPVNSIIVTTPSTLPSDTPREVIESGLYFRFGPSGTTFSQDVMITMDFNPEDFEGRAPVIYTYTSEDGWISLETTVDWENGRATAMISHFSLYALFGADGEETPLIAAETQGKDTDVHVVQEEGTPVETEEGSGILFWVVGLVLVLGIGAAILMNRKKHGEL